MTDGHITPVGKSVLDDFRLDHAFVVKAKLAIHIQRIADLGPVRLNLAL